MTKWNFALALLTCTTIVVFIFAHMQHRYGTNHSLQVNANAQNGRIHTAGASANGVAAASNTLIGDWDETDFSSASDTMDGTDVPIHSFEFRSDGSFAEMSYGKLVNYTQKCNQFSEWCGSLRYPASATSTGRWSIEDLSQLTNESVYAVSDETTTSVSSLITESIQAGTVVLKLNIGAENAEYFGVVLSDSGNRLNLFYLFGGDAYGIYKRVVN